MKALVYVGPVCAVCDERSNVVCWIFYVDAGIGLWRGDVEEVDIEDLHLAAVTRDGSHEDPEDGANTTVDRAMGDEPLATVSSDVDPNSFAASASGHRRRLGCVACPAHTWIFELSTGACITNRDTRAARVHHTKIDETGVVSVSLRPVQPTPADMDMVAAIPKAAVDRIQLDMVEKALARKFPDSESDQSEESE